MVGFQEVSGEVGLIRGNGETYLGFTKKKVKSMYS